MKLLLTSLLLFMSLQASATQQIKEEFTVDQARFEISQLPLDSYIDQKSFHEKVKPQMCSANWRGYRGSWALEKEMLVLRYLVANACDKSPKPIDVDTIFPNKSYPIAATWYTGKIIVRIGERTFLSPKEHGLSGVEYEAVVYDFHSGKLVSRSIETITNRW
ncbi:hypothetical protein [Microbulbifer sp. THAF38]|uniref:hypothetical protein n=1 Tax=Microbulbifer sp. THAF38 TaxID=2587856 RepID=UPI00126909D0|nr:hypothetical protein [Microbulbifer sp. THAF38]QFT54213.1 hypothetical protein FIU95_06530 [Microbulbifer sp. THAF38]